MATISNIIINDTEYSVITNTLSDGFYLNLSFYEMWKFGGCYSPVDGSYVNDGSILNYANRRGVYIHYIKKDDLTATFDMTLSTLSEDGLAIILCEYDASMTFIKSTELYHNNSFIADERTEYYSLSLRTLGKEKSMSAGQWAIYFSTYFPTIKLKSTGYIEYDPTLVESFITASEVYTEEELTIDLLEKNNQVFANKLWQTQISTGLYTLTGSELDNRNITYFVSTSEGSDNNDGLSPNSPIKSLSSLSGLSNINVLLKCGDVFKLDEAFTLGNNCIYAAYGEGNRPIVDFYTPFNLILTKISGYDNIWKTDLNQIPSIIQEVKGKQNCNIGSLRINGEVNWKRLIEPWLEIDTGEVDSEGNPITIKEFNISLMQSRADGCWGIDWYNDLFYIYVPDGEDPNAWNIEYALVGTALSTSCKNTIIKGIEFTGASGHAINATNSENLTIKCCYFHHIGGGFHKNSGLRYGNAIQIWDSGINILCKYNYSSDCFDTCYTSQGTTNGVHKENIEFSYNVGSQAFWILEDYGNIYDNTTIYKNVIYKHNVAYDARNISANDNPEEHYAREDGADTPKEGFDNWYSYRNGYQFQQCCNIMAGGDSNVSNVGNEPVKFYDNIAWGTTRTLVKHGTDLLYEDWGTTHDILIKGFRGNLLYNDFLEPKAYYQSYNVIKPPAIIRIDCKTSSTDTKKKGKYFDSIFMFHDSNILSQHYPEDDYDNSNEMAQLNFLVGQISGQRAESIDNYTEVFIEVEEDMTVEKFIINGQEHRLVDVLAVHDENYVHTSNDYTDADMEKVSASISRTEAESLINNKFSEISSGDIANAVETYIAENPIADSLTGKRILCVGDSICEGVGANNQPYAHWIKEWHSGAEVINLGVAGMTIAQKDSSITNSMPVRIASGEFENEEYDDIDIIVFEGGINDLMNNVKLGYIQKGYNITNYKTFCQGMEYMFSYFKELYPKARMIFMSTHSVVAYDYNKSQAWWGAASEICAKWGVEFLDLFGLICTNKISGLQLHPDYEVHRDYYAKYLNMALVASAPLAATRTTNYYKHNVPVMLAYYSGEKSFNVGDTVSTSGWRINMIRADLTTYVNVSSEVTYDISDVDNTTAGVYPIHIAYTEDGITVSIDVDVTIVGDSNIEPEEIILEDISATKTVTSYEVGSEIDTSDISVTAYYSDGSSAIITNNLNIDISNINNEVAGEYNISVSYTENDITRTTQIQILITDVFDVNIVAEGIEADSIEWKLYNTGELTLKNTNEEVASIPAYDTENVQPWNEYMTSITKVTILGGKIKDIGEAAFSTASNLTELDFSKNEYLVNGEPRVNIAKSAFSKTGFKTLVLNNVDTIGSSAFMSCTNMTEFTTDALTFQGSGSFNKCTKLEKITLTNPNVTLSSSALTGTSVLTDVYINRAEDELTGAPWGAAETVTFHFNSGSTTEPDEPVTVEWDDSTTIASAWKTTEGVFENTTITEKFVAEQTYNVKCKLMVESDSATSGAIILRLGGTTHTVDSFTVGEVIEVNAQMKANTMWTLGNMQPNVYTTNGTGLPWTVYIKDLAINA